MHAAALEYVREHAGGLTAWPRVVEFGGRDINGSPRQVVIAGEYFSIDLVAGTGVDLVADAASWDGEGEWDLIVCCEVLEHSDNIAGLLDSAGRALRPGGTLIVTAACDPREGHSAIDGGPLRDGEHYRNLTEDDLTVAWGETTDIVWDREAGDVRATIVKTAA